MSHSLVSTVERSIDLFSRGGGLHFNFDFNLAPLFLVGFWVVGAPKRHVEEGFGGRPREDLRRCSPNDDGISNPRSPRRAEPYRKNEAHPFGNDFLCFGRYGPP